MEIIGKLNSFTDQILDWVIPNFSLLPQENDLCYDSPTFTFNGYSWNLSIYPNGEKLRNSVGFIDLFLQRKSPGPQISLDFSLSLKNSSKEKEVEEHFTKTFISTFDGFGVICFISRSQLSERKAVLLPSDVLTIVCTLKYPQSVVNASESSVSGSSICNKTTMFRDLKELFLGQEHCDVILKVKEREFPAHKAILTARSPVFASTFRHNMKEKETGIVNIEDCEPSIFLDFLRFLYCEEVEILSKENVFDLFTAADKYDVPGLRTTCIEFMKDNLFVDTFFKTITLALQYKKAKLIHLCTEFFVKKALKIMETDEWQSFAAENPMQSKKLRVKFVSSVNDRNI